MNPQLIPDGMSTIADAATLFGISTQVLYAAINDGSLQTYEVRGIRAQLVRIADVKKLLEPQPKKKA